MSSETEELKPHASMPKMQSPMKYLTFNLGDLQYGVPLREVTEVIGLPLTVAIPGAPGYFLGLINLRGKVITAIDLAMKLGLAPASLRSKKRSVIITDLDKITLGCVVDSINSVISLSESEIEQDVSACTADKQDVIRGVARFADKPMILLLDLKQAASVAEIVKEAPHE